MIHLLPSELQQYLSKFVNNVDVYMRINKELYEESKQEYFDRIRRQNINSIIYKKLKIDEINLDWEFNILPVISRGLNTPIMFRSNIDFCYDHMFVPIDMFNSYISSYSKDDVRLWHDAVVTINGNVTVGKINYERFIK